MKTETIRIIIAVTIAVIMIVIIILVGVKVLQDVAANPMMNATEAINKFLA